MAASPWHIWISRFHMQKFLLPLCESITLLGLILAMTSVKKWRRYWGALLATFGFILGLHAYWACYVLAPVWATFLLYLFIFHRSGVRRNWAPLLLACILTFALAVPTIWHFSYELGSSGYVKSKFDFGDSVYLHKVVRNLKFLFWGLSSASEYECFVTAPVTFLFLVGLVKAVTQFRSSIPSALIVINFTWFFIGIAATWAHDMYMTGLIFSVYCLAGQGLAWIGQSLMSTFAGGRWLFLGVAPIALVCQQAVANYPEALVFPRHTSFGPYVNPGTHLRNEMRAFTKTHSVWASRPEMGDGLWWLHEQGFPEYAFVENLNVFSPEAPWFDADKVQGTAGVELYLRPSKESQRLIDETLKKLYPHLTVTEIPVPAPYNQYSGFQAPKAIRVSIAVAAINQLKGATSTRVGDMTETQGFLLIPRDAVYSFCHNETSTPLLTIDDQSIEVPPCAAQGTPKYTAALDAGLHPVLISGSRGASELDLLVRSEGTNELRFANILWGFTPPSAGQWAREHRAPYGVPASFVYESVDVYPQKDLAFLRGISGFSATEPILSFMDGVYSFDRASNTKKRILPSIQDQTRLGRPSSPLLLQRKGTEIVAVNGTEIRKLFDSGGMQIVDFDHQGERASLLYPDGRVLISKDGAIELTAPATQGAGASSVAWAFDFIFVATRSGIYFQNITTNTSGKILGGVSLTRGLSSDAEGNVYAWTGLPNLQPKVFSNTGRRLFNASAGSTALFVDKDGKPINGLTLPKFLGDEVLVAEGNNLRLFRRRALNER